MLEFQQEGIMKKAKHASHHPSKSPHLIPHGDEMEHVPEDLDMHFFLPPLKPGDPGPAVLEKIKPPYVAIVLPENKPAVLVPSVRNPAPNKSFGYVNRFVKVAGMLTPATLVIQLDPRSLDMVSIDTLRVFRW